MPSKLLGAIPVLPSLDLVRTQAFWTKTFGFEIWGYREPPIYGCVHRDGVELHYYRVDDKSLCENASCRLIIDDLTELHDIARAADVIHPSGALIDQEWGWREFTVVDPDGACIHFCQDLEPAG